MGTEHITVSFVLWMVAINVAIFIFIPLLAVYITGMLHDRAELRKDKMIIFKTLMGHRSDYWQHPDAVNALNSLAVIFSNSKRVLEKWREAAPHLREQPRSTAYIEAQNALLLRMAEDLGYDSPAVQENITQPANVSQTS